MKVLVTAATGTVGAHVVHALQERGVPVRAFVRDRGRAAARLGPGVELVAGDFADRGSLDRALHGVQRLYLACGNVPGQLAHERRVIDAARAAGVERVVKLSGPSVAPSLLFERWHAELERELHDSGLPAVVLRPSSFMTNLLASAEAVAQTGRLFAPAGGAVISFVDPRDVGEAAAAALTARDRPAGVQALTGPEALSFAQVAHELSVATGRRVEYVDIPGEAALEALTGAGLPPAVAEFVVGMFAAQRAGAMAHMTDAVERLTGRPPRPFAQFAREHAATFGGAAVAAA